MALRIRDPFFDLNIRQPEKTASTTAERQNAIRKRSSIGRGVMRTCVAQSATYLHKADRQSMQLRGDAQH